MTDPMVAWEAACRAVDEQQVAVIRTLPNAIRQRLDALEILDLVHALFPYPPKPEAPKEVVFDGIRCRRFSDGQWEWKRWEQWEKSDITDDMIIAYASLLPKSDRQKIAEAP